MAQDKFPYLMAVDLGALLRRHLDGRLAVQLPNQLKESGMAESTLRISKEDAHGIKQALLSSASGASTMAATYPEDAAKGLAKAFVFLDEISRSGPATSETA